MLGKASSHGSGDCSEVLRLYRACTLLITVSVHHVAARVNCTQAMIASTAFFGILTQTGEDVRLKGTILLPPLWIYHTLGLRT